ncbi:hypothetical protein FRB99_000245 [Tulasnella sp. 403]|nr:hypothetical protein FRB99_000245 [Tulasnella sp. 403]
MSSKSSSKPSQPAVNITTTNPYVSPNSSPAAVRSSDAVPNPVTRTGTKASGSHSPSSTRRSGSGSPASGTAKPSGSASSLPATTSAHVSASSNPTSSAFLSTTQPSSTPGPLPSSSAGQEAGVGSTTHSSRLSPGAIAGIIIGAVGGLVALFLLALFYIRRRQYANRRKDASGHGTYSNPFDDDHGRYGSAPFGPDGEKPLHYSRDLGLLSPSTANDPFTPGPPRYSSPDSPTYFTQPFSQTEAYMDYGHSAIPSPPPSQPHPATPRSATEFAGESSAYAAAGRLDSYPSRSRSKSRQRTPSSPSTRSKSKSKGKMPALTYRPNSTLTPNERESANTLIRIESASSKDGRHGTRRKQGERSAEDPYEDAPPSATTSHSMRSLTSSEHEPQYTRTNPSHYSYTSQEPRSPFEYDHSPRLQQFGSTSRSTAAKPSQPSPMSPKAERARSPSSDYSMESMDDVQRIVKLLNQRSTAATSLIPEPPAQVHFYNPNALKASQRYSRGMDVEMEDVTYSSHGTFGRPSLDTQAYGVGRSADVWGKAI